MALRKQEFDGADHPTETPKKRFRITFDVSPTLRRRIKLAAVKDGVSIGEYLGQILEQIVPNEPEELAQRGHPVTKEAIERLKRVRDEIMEERQGVPFPEDSAEILRQEREKRTRYLIGEKDV